MTAHDQGGSRLVYTSDQGRICPECGNPEARCSCRKKAAGTPRNDDKRRPSEPKDGVARIRREVGGRGGKTVTTVSGLALSEEQCKALAAVLKKKLGTGGSVKNGIIEIQGDHRDAVLAELQKQGYTCKLAGG